MKKVCTQCGATAAAVALMLAAAPSAAVPAEPTVLRGAEAGAPVRPQVIDIDVRDLPLASEWRPGDAIKEIPRRHTGPVPIQEPAPPIAVEDPLLALQADAPGGDDADFATPALSFAGQGFSGVNPPDTVGDVGPSHYVQAINHSSGTSVTVYGKTGGVLAGPFILDTLGSGGSCASGLGDPVVLYDSPADRWLLSEFSSSGNALCVYVSQTSSPVSGGWFRYQFTAPNFPDYPKYAVWPDAYYVGTNEGAGSPVYALDRARMLQGLSATFQRFTAPDLAGFSFQMLTPADLDGAAAPPAGASGIFMRHRDDEAHNPPGTPQDFLEIWEFHADWTTPANSTFSGPTNIAVTNFDSNLCGLTSFSCIPQPSGANALDPLREVIMFRLQYRNFGTRQSLVGNLVTDVNGADRAGIRWFELRKTGASWALHQEGTYSPDTVNRWMGSAAMDGSGNLAVGYSVSNSSTFPGLRFSGRLSGDPLGTLPQGETTLVGGSASNASNRWGDYAAMSVDPADDCTFWFTSQYSPSSSWGTWIGAFKFASCGGTPTPDFSISASPTSVSVTQGGSGTSTITIGSLNGFGGAVGLSASGTPSGVSASFVPTSVNAPGSSTLTFTATAGATTGTFSVTVTGTSGSLIHSTSISLTVNPIGGGGDLTAVFDAARQAPACNTVGRSCDSGASLVLGRAALGPEPNQPNSINDSCADGTSGTFHSDESNDRVKVTSVDGTNFAAGKSVRIDATVWAWTTPSADAADFYYASNAVSPTWTLIGTVVPSAAGAQTLSQTYTLPAGALQAVRVQFRYQSTNASCAAGAYNDRDDLVFAVTSTPVTTVFTDNFETALGWTTNPNGTDTATIGAWERGDPEQTTSSGVKQLGTTVSGVNDLVTARLAGASAGVNDIDGGTTSIQSPLITLPATGTLTLSFQYYLAHGSNSSSADFFRAFVVGSSTTQVFQSLGAATNRNGAWTAASANISAFAGQTVRIRFEAADASTASLVEAGVDDVTVTQQ